MSTVEHSWEHFVVTRHGDFYILTAPMSLFNRVKRSPTNIMVVGKTRNVLFSLYASTPQICEYYAPNESNLRLIVEKGK